MVSKKSFQNLILKNAETLRALNQNIKETFKHRDNSEQARQAWKEACTLFHKSFNRLAFPGGLDQGLDLLKKQDPDIIDVAIEFLQADPHYHRSGYIKRRIINRLKQVSLTHSQINRLKTILLSAITGKYVVYKDYYRLAAKIQDSEFIKKVKEIITEYAQIEDQSWKSKLILKRAKTMLGAIMQAKS